MDNVPERFGETDAGKPVAAVTGATGFLGRYIVAALSRSGWHVRALVRSEPMHEQQKNLNTEIVLGDLTDVRALERFCAGADAIVHIAGAIKAKDRAGFFSVNAQGSENLARAVAAIASEVPIVHVSSMAAREPHLSDYAASKLAGEEALRTNLSGPLTILRPSAVYGPWDEATKPIFQMAAKGRIFLPRAPNSRICLIHADDVADAVVSVLRHRSGTATYELSDDNTEGYSWHEIASAASKAMRKEPKVFDVPLGILKLGGLVSELSSRLVGAAPILTLGKTREMLHTDWSSRAESQPPETCWRPRISLSDGFETTATWYSAHNFG